MFSRSVSEILGVESPPLPRGEMGPKSPALSGLKQNWNTIVYWEQYTTKNLLTD